jgi:hypothetical protein
MAESTTVTETVAPAGLDLPDDGDVVLFPADVEGESGHYSRSAAEFADELAEAELAVRTWHDSDHTEWFTDRDSFQYLVLVGIVSAAGWDGIKFVLAERKKAAVDLTMGFRKDGSVRWLRIKGPADSVAQVVDEVKPESDR